MHSGSGFDQRRMRGRFGACRRALPRRSLRGSALPSRLVRRWGIASARGQQAPAEAECGEAGGDHPGARAETVGLFPDLRPHELVDHFRDLVLALGRPREDGGQECDLHALEPRERAAPEVGRAGDRGGDDRRARFDGEPARVMVWRPRARPAPRCVFPRGTRPPARRRTGSIAPSPWPARRRRHAGPETLPAPGTANPTGRRTARPWHEAHVAARGWRGYPAEG